MTERGGAPGGLRIGLAIAAAIAIVAANAGWVALDLGLVHPAGAVLETDHYHYIEMAKGPGNADRPVLASQPPFCYRVLTPGLVFALTQLGIGRDAAFYTLTQLCAVGFLVVLYVSLAITGLGVNQRLLGVVVAGALPGAVRWYSYQYWMTDPLALLLVALAFLAIRMGWTRTLFAACVAGVAARETALIVVPFYFLYLFRCDGLAAALRRGLPLAVACGATTALIRLAVDAGDAAPLPALIADVARWRWSNLLDNQLYFATIGSFGVLLPLLAAAPRRTLARWTTRYEDLSVVAAVYASLLLARNTDRLLVYAVPVILPLALENLFWLTERARRLGPALVAGVLLAQGVFFVETVTVGVPAISIRQPFSATVTWAMAGLTVLLVAAAWPARRSGS